MPKLNDPSLENVKLPGSYGYSATKLENLGATEYTLVSIIVDESGSVASFKSEMIDTIKSIVNACRLSPRADNLLIRLVSFDSKLTEVHGFKLLSTCNPDDYNGLLNSGGTTALYDASVNAIDATISYGKTLVGSDFSVNGIVFVITDGGDNASSNSALAVADSLKRALSTESLESLVSILIGVNVGDSGIAKYLDDFKVNAGFTQNVNLADASKNTLAKLAQFVSKSISSQSQALGSGGPSQSLSI